MPDLSLAKGADALLMLGDSERIADLFYATGFRAPDPFHYIATPDRAWVLVKDLELDRARQQVRDAEVLPLRCYEAARHQQGDNAAPGGVIADVLRELDLHSLQVPAYFPVATADDLRNAGFEITVVGSPLFPNRVIKTEAEVEAISNSLAAAESAMSVAIDAIRSAEIRDNLLVLGGEPLTSEAVRRLIHHTLLESDCRADHTIVAGGEQAIDPHQDGHGPLPAHAPIIVDIFPCSALTGYYGDITRTVVRGTASVTARELYDSVAAAQAFALETVADGVDGRLVHEGVSQHFVDAGYKTGEKDGRMQGYFHGTGHGLGLEIHEAPFMSRRCDPLRTGQVVTIEPGLYYAGIGGVRIEDVVVIENGGCRNLTSFPEVFEL
ncbi:MAG: Xaa-Pro peptidase family protein [Candidatus Latescibacterota bacterium]|nr:Xaa-Pro peptidase family protein [Candidatus Latescibacterota bacterium]